LLSVNFIRKLAEQKNNLVNPACPPISGGLISSKKKTMSEKVPRLAKNEIIN
jgi:hypothetical protein